MTQNRISIKSVRNEILANPDVKKAYDEMEQEFAVAQALIDARMKAQLTQQEVAHRLGVSQPVVARWESGRNTSIKSIARYAKAVGQPIQIRILPV